MQLVRLSDLSDDDVVRVAREICAEGNRLTATLLVHLIEIEERRLDLRSACPSLVEFCVENLGLSERTAWRRIHAARLVKRLPRLLPWIERGAIHLCTLRLIGDHLTEENLDDRVCAASGKRTQEVLELVAKWAPRPDVAPSMSELSLASGALPLTPTCMPPQRVATSMEPLSEKRHRLELTVGDATRAKIERALSMSRHRNRKADLEIAIDQAFDAYLEKLEKECRAKTRHPRSRSIAKKEAKMSKHVSNEVRAEVFARDGEQCTFADDQGRRCPSRDMLELDHIVPRALGGSNAATNLRVACRGHNILYAEQKLGKDFVRDRIRARSAAPPLPPVAVDVAAAAPLDPETLATAKSALVRLGFRATDARGAVDAIEKELLGSIPIEDVIRRALAVLT